MADLMNYRYVTLGDYKSSTIPYVKNTSEKLKNKFNFQLVNSNEVIQILNNLNIKKPQGPSRIPCWVFKDAAPAIKEHITYLMNLIIITNRFPEDLKKAYMMPIFKKGERNEPSNYRPIAITPILSKIFEKLLAKQIRQFLKENKILSPTQFGFQDGKSSIDALYFLTESIKSNLDKNIPTQAAFLDLSKAFDSLDHSILCDKLFEIGFSNDATVLTKNYLSNRQQRTNINGTFSN